MSIGISCSHTGPEGNDFSTDENNLTGDKSGACLVWRDLCIFTQNCKEIIHNAKGVVKPGTLVALLGPSGAGKSTLISALAYQQTAGFLVEGDILINRQPVGPFMHKIAGFVHQEDIFIENLSVLEHLTFSAHLRLDRRISNQDKLSRIQNLLEKTGLLPCANSKIRRGIDGEILSGGERKRLAFAIELLTNPVILFCDEPTTGLDSYSAKQLIQMLSSLALKGTTTICTIHQPSSDLFAIFQEVLLLAEGRIIFMGAPAEALSFFEENGYMCPKNYNPADFLISVISSNSKQSKAAQRLSKLFENNYKIDWKDLEPISSETIEKAIKSNFKKASWPVMLILLSYRNILSTYRDPTVALLRILQKAVIALLAGMCFAGTTVLTQSGIQAIQGSLFIMVSENTFHPMYSILSYFPQRYPLFMREKRSGVYSTAQYYLSHIIAMVPGLIIEPVLFVLIFYWFVGLRMTSYPFIMTAVLVILVINTATACGIFFSTVFNSVPVAMAYLVPVDYIFMITSGIFIKTSTIPFIFSWLQYFSWMLYANEALSGLQWDGIQNITCYGQDIQFPCLHNGEEVMDNYNFTFGHFHRDITLMILLYIVFHILAYIFLLRRAKHT